MRETLTRTTHFCMYMKNSMKTSEIFDGENSSLKKTFEAAVSGSHDQDNKDHTKCRKLGTSDICVCCPCGCDTPIDEPNYAELHGAPTEQKEEWEEEFEKLMPEVSYEFCQGHLNDGIAFISNLLTSRDTYWKETISTAIAGETDQTRARIMHNLDILDNLK